MNLPPGDPQREYMRRGGRGLTKLALHQVEDRKMTDSSSGT